MTDRDARDQAGKTPEEVVHAAIWGKKLIETDTPVILANDAHAISTAAVGALRAAGRLVEGASTDEQIMIARPVVPHGPAHLTEDEGTAHYLREVVRKIDTGFLNVGGSNVTATVRKLMLDTAAALTAAGVTPPAPSAEWPTVERAARVLDVWLADQYDGDQNAARIPVIHAIGDALAAPAPVDEAKLTEVIWEEQESRVRGGYVIHTPDTARSTARAIREHLDSLRGESAATGATLPSETAARLLAVAELAVELSLEWQVVNGKREARIRVEDLRSIAKWLRGEG